MKEETAQFDDAVVTYYIGTNAADNFAAIDKGAPNDYWFHAKDVSSCHVVANIPDIADKKSLRAIVRRGALLCKQNTSKLKALDRVVFVYTRVKNVVKMDKPGLVTLTNEKIIVL